MARQYGWGAKVNGKIESVYGTPPAGNYVNLPFVRFGLGAEQGLIPSDVLGQGREPQTPGRDVIRCDGPVIVPVDAINFGYWLKLLLGAPVTTGAGPYTHTFISGATTLPSMSFEGAMPEVPAFFMNAGARANSMELNIQRSGLANATFNLIGQGETKAGVTGAGVPTDAVFTRFNQFQASIKRNTVALANITGARLTYSNNLEPVETIRSDGKIDGVDPGIVSVTGRIDARFADTTLYDDAVSGTAIELELAYTIDANTSLVITVDEVFLPRAKLPIEGPGGVQAGFDWIGAKDAAALRSMRAVLKNTLATYP